MKLNIDSLTNKERESVDFDFCENVESIRYYGVDYNLISPLHLTGRISRDGRNFLLKAKVNFDYKGACSRCLKDLEVPVAYEIDAYLMKEKYDEDSYEDVDIFPLEGTEVDLLELVDSTLTYNMPQKVLCSEDCKGICSGCGVDLNTHDCVCEDSMGDDDIDPRFAKLKELLK